MSDTPSSDPPTWSDQPQPRDPKQYKKPVLGWTEISCLASVIIMAWAVSIPLRERRITSIFRQSKQDSSEVQHSRQTAQDLADQQAAQRSEFHQQQVEELQRLDKELLRQVKRVSESNEMPDHMEPDEYQQRRRHRITQEARMLQAAFPDGKIVEGTMEWETLQDMKKSMEDYQ